MKKPSKEAFCNGARSMFIRQILREVRNKTAAEDILHDLLFDMLKKWDKIKEPENYARKSISHITQNYNKRQPILGSIDNVDPEIEFLVTSADGTDSEFTSVIQQYQGLMNEVIKLLPQYEKEMIEDVHAAYKYNHKTDKYEKMSIEEFCKKHNIARRTYTNILKKVNETIMTIINGRKTA